MTLKKTLLITQASFMWLAALCRRLHNGSCCCAPDVGPHCVSLSFRGAGRGESSRRGHRGARVHRAPLSPPQGRHRQGPRLEHCGDISQMLLPWARSPARWQWPSSWLSFLKGGLSRWVTPPHPLHFLLHLTSYLSHSKGVLISAIKTNIPTGATRSLIPNNIQ